MSSNDHSLATPPDDLLPAQLGIVLVRRPTLGHAAATLVSLAERGLLAVTGPRNGDWLIGSPGQSRSEALARFETVLLEALPPASDPLPLTGDTAEKLAPAVRKFADGLVKDAVHSGWLRHLHHDQLTRDGEDLAARAREFRTALRRANAVGRPETLTGHLPYALAFGLVSPDSAPAAELPLVHFAAAFIDVCSELPDWQHVEPQQGYLGADFSRDEWRGMPPGGRSIATQDSATPNLPWP